MHCVSLAEFAATISHHGPAIAASQAVIPAEVVTCYWACSKNRRDLWHQSIARYQHARQSGQSNAIRSWWDRHLVVLEEIIVSELLTRVVAAITLLIDQQSERDELSPVAHAVYSAHMDASNRVHQLLLHGRGVSVHDRVKLNRLRQGVERWTDALLGRMSVKSTAGLRYSVDQSRADEFAEEIRTIGFGTARDTSSWLMNASMRDVLTQRTSEETGLPQANQDVADAVLLMLRPKMFDDLGTIKSAWMQQISQSSALHECSPLAIPGAKRQTQQREAALDEKVKFERWHL